VFLPLRNHVRIYGKKRESVQLPLFPGYLFVYMSAGLNARVKILRTTGVIGLLGNRFYESQISDSEIEALKTVVKHQLDYENWPMPSVGQEVRIRGGCLDGMRGLLIRTNGDYRFTVKVSLIERAVVVQLSGYRLEAFEYC
jgi:transcriptional antiterminator NusG